MDNCCYRVSHHNDAIISLVRNELLHDKPRAMITFHGIGILVCFLGSFYKIVIVTPAGLHTFHNDWISVLPFFCNSCGNEFAKWSGQCPTCHEWNTLVEATPFLKTPRGGAKKISTKSVESFSVKDALTSQEGYTLSTGISEFDRVLGPGITRGGVYLLAGQPGIGKSTLLTQLAISVPNDVYYVCSEENPAQVATRIKRLSKKETPHIHLLNTSLVDSVCETIAKNPNSLIIIDSIQSVYTNQNVKFTLPKFFQNCDALERFNITV